MRPLVINIRGGRDSPRADLARRYLPDALAGDVRGRVVGLNYFSSPTTNQPDRKVRAVGQFSEMHNSVVIGRYTSRPDNNGLDSLPDAATGQAAIRRAMAGLMQDSWCSPLLKWGTKPPTVICEGLRASCEFDTWRDFATDCRNHGVDFIALFVGDIHNDPKAQNFKDLVSAGVKGRWATPDWGNRVLDAIFRREL